MDLRLGPKIYLIVQNRKKRSHLPFTVTVTRRHIFKELTKLSQHATFQSRVTVSVLEIVDGHLSEKKCIMVIAEYIFMQIDQLLYKYSFLRYWFLFKINGIKGLLSECLKI